MSSEHKKICPSYVGVCCIDGSCPKAHRDEYIEYGIPVVYDCSECHRYYGCSECRFYGDDKYCEDPEHKIFT